MSKGQENIKMELDFDAAKVMQLILNAAFNDESLLPLMRSNGVFEQAQELVTEFGAAVHDRDGWCIDPECPDNQGPKTTTDEELRGDNIS